MPELIPSSHHPAPRADGRLSVTITYLDMSAADWTRRGKPPALDIAIVLDPAPTVAFYRELYDRVGRPWLWYERRLISDTELASILSAPGHELHVARHDGELVGYFELLKDEILFFGLTPDYVGRRIGPWLLDKAIERSLALGNHRLRLNTNSLDHPRALDTYCKAGFHILRRETKDIQDPRSLWPDLYR